MNAAEVPPTQRAVVQRRYGPLREALEWSSEHPVPAPRAGEVLVRVGAAAVNPIDAQMVVGDRRLITRRRFPFVPLFDLAGVVTAVGEGVTQVRVGDRVHADNQRHAGGASQYAVVEERLLRTVPRGLAPTAAAALPLAAQTALTCLERAGVGPGARVAVIGASGGVGHLAVQMARALGAAQVVGVCSARGHDLVTSLGADQVVDRTRATLAGTHPRGSFDVVLDCVGGRDQWDQARAVLVPGGVFVTIARDEDGRVTARSAARMVATTSARRLRSTVGERVRYLPVFLDASAGLLARVDAMVDAGLVTAHIGASYPFTHDGVLSALEAARGGRALGKVVVDLDVG